MSCNGFDLCGAAYGSGGRTYFSFGSHSAQDYSVETTYEQRNSYVPTAEITSPRYASQHHSDAEFWKPTKFYEPSVKYDASPKLNNPFAYNPSLDLALSYLSYRQQTKPSQKVLENERQQLEELIAQEKQKVKLHAA